MTSATEGAVPVPASVDAVGQGPHPRAPQGALGVLPDSVARLDGGAQKGSDS